MASVIAWTALANFEASAFTLGSTESAQKGWENPEVTVNVNASSCPIAESTLHSAVDTAFALWNSVATSRLKLTRGAASSTTAAVAAAKSATDYPLIVCDASFGTTTSSDSGFVAGIGIFLFDTSTYYIQLGYVLLNAQTGAKANIANFTETQLAVLIAHEIGHLVGLGHSSEARSIMYYDASDRTELTLAQDDRDAVTYLYPRAEPRDPVFGCGGMRDGSDPAGTGPTASDAAALASLGLAPLAFALRRRLNFGKCVSKARTS